MKTEAEAEAFFNYELRDAIAFRKATKLKTYSEIVNNLNLNLTYLD